MLWKTHVRITFEVIGRLGILPSSEETERLREGVLIPDKWGDYPHHYGKSLAIRENLLTSRMYFLKDDLFNAYHYLGIALHYIQDSYTSMASFYPKHHSWEEDIENCKFVFDIEEMIQYVLRNNSFERDRCLNLARELSKEACGRETLRVATLTGYEASKSFAKPIVDLNLAFRASYIVAKSVLSSKVNPELNKQLEHNLAIHEALLNEAENLLVNKILQLAQQRQTLLKQKVTNQGIINKLKNLFLGLKVKAKDSQLDSKFQEYLGQKHFQKVSLKYKEVTDRIIAPYFGWYSYSVPPLDFKVVKRQLIPLQDDSHNVIVDKEAMASFVQSGIKR